MERLPVGTEEDRDAIGEHDDGDCRQYEVCHRGFWIELTGQDDWHIDRGPVANLPGPHELPRCGRAIRANHLGREHLFAGSLASPGDCGEPDEPDRRSKPELQREQAFEVGQIDDQTDRANNQAVGQGAHEAGHPAGGEARRVAALGVVAQGVAAGAKPGPETCVSPASGADRSIVSGLSGGTQIGVGREWIESAHARSSCP